METYCRKETVSLRDIGKKSIHPFDILKEKLFLRIGPTNERKDFGFCELS